MYSFFLVQLARDNRLQDIEKRRVLLANHIAALESYSKYSEELMSKGSKFDVVREGDALQSRAEELLKIELRTQFDGWNGFSLEFVPNDSVEKLTRNVIGEVVKSDKESGWYFCI